MALVKVPHEFFVRERNDIYTDWQQALFRELFQNSLDAGATEIHIVNFVGEDGETCVSFEDNGIGMSAEDLEEIYFCLGKSKKPDGSIGGFGRARILTNFSMDKYKIYTRDCEVSGSGAEYHITRVTDPDLYVKGCRQFIQTTDCDVDAMDRALRGLLYYCNLNCKVYINNTEYTDWFPKTDFLRSFVLEGQTTPFMVLSKSYKFTNKIVVRAKGLWTFSSYNPNPQTLLLDLDVNRIRDILKASRDNFAPPFDRAFDMLKEELATESETALKKKFNREFVLYRGKGFYKNRRHIREQLIVNNNGKAIESSPAQLIAERIEALKDNAEMRLLRYYGHDYTTEDAEAQRSAHKISEFLPDIPFYTETESSLMMDKVESYKPTNWEFEIVGNGMRWLKGRNNFMLLMAWYEAVKPCVDILLDMDKVGTDSISWSVGWCFDDHAHARMKKVNAGYCLMIRPIDQLGNQIFSLVNKMSRKSLMANAKHEVAHIVSDVHNESFASILTSIDERYDEALVHKAMKNLNF